ncbi:MAG: signal peptidase II [Nanoarchaeota archaeon]|nr:signal peptidase II [Nanoarchaeota archaeon]
MAATKNKNHGKFFINALSFFSIAVLLVILDQFIKVIIERKIMLGESITIINKFLYLTLTHNTGMAFGLFHGQYSFSLWISIIVIGLVLYYYDEMTSVAGRIALALVLGGTIGNIIDRLRFGFVVDYIHFPFWPVFNLADMALTVGVAILLMKYWKGE